MQPQPAGAAPLASGLSTASHQTGRPELNTTTCLWVQQTIPSQCRRVLLRSLIRSVRTWIWSPCARITNLAVRSSLATDPLIPPIVAPVYIGSPVAVTLGLFAAALVNVARETWIALHECDHYPVRANQPTINAGLQSPAKPALQARSREKADQLWCPDCRGCVRRDAPEKHRHSRLKST